MTKFLDGPAKGEVLMLRNCPRYLRVTHQQGVWDALDIPSDTPRPSEEVYAYRRKGDCGHAFVDFGGKSKKASGCYAIAEYEIVADQPLAEVLRNNTLWQYWVDHSEP